MAKKLILHLQTKDPAIANYAIIDEQHHIEQSVTHISLSDIPVPTMDIEIIAIIPATDVVLTTADLPNLNRHRLQQALPYALEEQMIDDVSTLHFAIGDTTYEDTWPVAIIAKQILQYWLTLLTNANLSPTILIPETLALPYQENAWHIVITKDQAIVRTGKYSGFASDLTNLSLMLKLQLNEIPQPHQIYLKNYDVPPIELPNNVADVPLQIQHLPQTQFINDLAIWFEQAPIINLLQNNYAAKSKITMVKKTWLVACILAAATLLVSLFGQSVSLAILHHQNNKLEKSIALIYRKNFPEATSITLPKERFEEKYKKLTLLANKNLFLTWLGYISKAFAESPNLHIQHLDFRNQQLSLELTAPTFDTLDKFTRALKQYGLNAKQQNAVTSGTQVKAMVLIQSVK